MSAGLDEMRAWIGRRESVEDHCDPRRVADLAAALDWERAPASGDRLPPGWHWIFFNPMARASLLGADGHPRRGGFLPPVPLPRRMWAGGRLSFRDAIEIGAPLRRYSEIRSVEAKEGRSGAMVFVIVRHRVFSNDSLALEEEHDIVYRAAAIPGSPPPAPVAAPAPASTAWRRRIAPDPVLLFRYSALTSNGHRIHYDHSYATKVEAYPGLVFHGPLMATLLMDLAERGSGRSLAAFAFRNRAPLFDVAPFEIAGELQASGEARLWATAPDGGLATEAEARFTS